MADETATIYEPGSAEGLAEARRRIAAVAGGGADTLDLGGLGLVDLKLLLDDLPPLPNVRTLYLGPAKPVRKKPHFRRTEEDKKLCNAVRTLPAALLNAFPRLAIFDLDNNRLAALPAAIGRLSALERLYLNNNRLAALPAAIGQLSALEALSLNGNRLAALPAGLGQLSALEWLYLDNNRLVALPAAIGQLSALKGLYLKSNPLAPELASAASRGVEVVKRYLRLQKVSLYEAKLVLVGEGEVGKSCLLGALRDDPWVENRPTTHGIEILPLEVTAPDGETVITLNGWDFGGQPVYRPTHQLFFSTPAIYLVVWKPREGPQQNLVLEWIRLVRHRAPDARILVVATHGGPKSRQPDIDRQAIWDAVGQDTVLDFFSVDSKPDDETNECFGIAELKTAIARTAAGLQGMGRKVPRQWNDARRELRASEAPRLALEEVMGLCRESGMEDAWAEDFIRISHELGHIIHYEHDPALRDTVILRPDWLTTAISYVLDDEPTRASHGLVRRDRLGDLWNDPVRAHQYTTDLHDVFIRLMERFDICYRIAEPRDASSAGSFLIAQLVPDRRPKPVPGWDDAVAEGDAEQEQICRIVEVGTERPATAEGVFFLLIVRLHKYSLGRTDFQNSVHWRRGLVLRDGYGAKALLQHVGDDIRITVRSPYPERFLSALTYEVKGLVEDFWNGLRCDVMVPCLDDPTCRGMFEVSKLLENKKRGRAEQPCPVCNEWQDVEQLLHNAPAAGLDPLDAVLARADVAEMLGEIRTIVADSRAETMDRFDALDRNQQKLVQQVEAAFTNMMRAMTDEAREGPRLFSLAPVDPGFFDRPTWASRKFQLTLWCEHSRLPLPVLNGDGDGRGTYELTLPREWLVKAAPVLKVLSTTLGLMLPVAASSAELLMDEAAYKGIENQLDLGRSAAEALLKGGDPTGRWLGKDDGLDLEPTGAIRAEGADLRQLQVWLKEKDPGFGGLVRVQNKHKEFLWVHPRFEDQY